MITILTPTYNRAYILQEAFDSLCRQTNRDFEWIIVDDGSTDHTEELVRGWQEKEPPFSLRYFRQENGGKHRAVNRGVALASTEYILILDSDDSLTEDATEWIHQWVKSIDGLPGFAGVSGLRGGKNGVIGGSPRGEFVDATNLERAKLGLMGDKAEVYKTEIMKQYPFPEYEGEKFLSEAASWDRIAQAGYKIRWFNRVIYRCEYLQDGLTRNLGVEMYSRNFQGFSDCTKLYLQTRSFPRTSLKIGHYALVAKYAGKTDAEICELLDIGTRHLFLGRILFWIKEQIKKMLQRRKREQTL